jgi:hypothetical protein
MQLLHNEKYKTPLEAEVMLDRLVSITVYYRSGLALFSPQVSLLVIGIYPPGFRVYPLNRICPPTPC